MIIRKTYPELQENHIIPMCEMLNCYAPDRKDRIASYNDAKKHINFKNNSRILFRYCDNEKDAERFQGTEVDVLFVDEATHQSEAKMKKLNACVRGVNDFPKRIYYTCNPGGEGHNWVKRLFIDRDFQENEDPNDYVFIQSLVTDNKALMESDPDYIRQLESLPPKLKEAWLYGNWYSLEGQYFEEFNRDDHVCEPFPIPKEWRRYRAIDYGLDMLACYWIAVDSTRRCYVYKELCEGDLPISTAAEKINAMTNEDEEIYITLAPPDLWNRSQETGRSKALIFGESGLPLVKSNNDREAGWLALKELMKKDANGESRLQIFNTCTRLIKNLPELQRDAKKPTDTATEPHEITHAPDALRYFGIYWTRPAPDQDQEGYVTYSKDLLQDYKKASAEVKKQMIERYGKPKL